MKRLDAVLAFLRRCGARRVLDLGCGSGDLLLQLTEAPGIEHIVGVDHDAAALARLREQLAGLPADRKARVELLHSSMTALPASLQGSDFDAAVLVESIEHVPPDRLSKLERDVFESIRPLNVLITTPNADFNVLLGLADGKRRHRDHRFEWGRARFQAWAMRLAARNAYRVHCRDLGRRDPLRGGISQMAIFECMKRRPGELLTVAPLR